MSEEEEMIPLDEFLARMDTEYEEEMRSRGNPVDGYEITAVIGMDHSPSCGVHITSSGQWCGEFNAENQYQDKLNSLTAKKGAGVMMEELRKMLQDNDIFPAYFAVDETDVLSYSSILEEL